jgi:phenylalanyl-tRNA synthetase beta chain
MKASFRWLKQLVPQLPDDPDAVAARLTAAGLEVEAQTRFGAGIETCVLAWVVSTRPHPTKSGLRIVTVDRGGGTQEVVCGAPNVPEPGGVVVLAPLGTHLAAKNMTIGRRDIGGVASEGMLCSVAELGLGDDASGILVLPPGFAAPGTRLVDAVETAQDTIFEIALTPNRPDGLGHLGLAREAAALYGIPWTRPLPEEPVRSAPQAIGELVTIVIEDGERCPHYGAAAVLDVSVGPSPLWLKWRLAALGVRSISTAVDVTNLLMLEYGHPMHAFDLDLVRGKRIVVRRAKTGEKLTTLDGEERALDPDDLVVCDGEGPVALAGVMGGASSEIRPETKRILLEVAYFDPRTVRRTARRHGLHTESSHRFERGVDHGDTRDVLVHAASMTARLCGGAVATGTALTVARPLQAQRVRLRDRKVERTLGVSVPWAESKTVLERLGFRVEDEKTGADGPEAIFLVPSHRPDVSREIDLVEEIVRVRGMDAVPGVLPAMKPTDDAGPREALFRRARQAGVSVGLSEALLFGFTSSAELAAIAAPKPVVELANPLSAQRDVMRTSLLVDLLAAVRRSRSRGDGNARLFATGSVFVAPESGHLARRAQEDFALPHEKPMLAAVLAGERPAHLAKPQPFDVWDAKGLAEALVQRLSRRTPTVRKDAAIPHLHPRGAAAIYVDNTRIGSLGPLHPDAVDALDLGGEVMVVELDLEALEALGPALPRYAPIPRFPPATRDIALVVKETVPAGEVEAAVRTAAGPLAERVELFDRFTGGSLPEGHVSLAFHVIYRATDRTLTDAEVDASHQKVVAEVRARFGAALRA